MKLIDAVKSAGVVGAGGAGFPTHVKLAAQADTFIINAAECEPLIETDKYLMRTFPEELIISAELIATHLKAKRKVIALKSKYKEEIKALSAAIDKHNSSFELVQMPSFYPAGDEQILVQFVTGKSVPERGLPLHVGAVVDNVGTVLNVGEAVAEKPVTDKYLSIVGEVEKPLMLKVPIGTSIKECIEMAKPLISKYDFILGGPMMGRVCKGEEAQTEFVTKTTGNVILLPKGHYLVERSELSISAIAAQTRSACIQCKMCTDMCPRYLIGHDIRPSQVMRNLYREKTIKDNVEYEHAFGSAINCCDCGICEMFACPMGLSPRKVNGYIKGKLAERKINPEKNQSPQVREGLDWRRIPTDRLIARLGLSKYASLHVKEPCREYRPKTVTLYLKQHIGAGAQPCRETGEFVQKGELIGSIGENALCANLHASITGKITFINNEKVVITESEE
ncbi:4Fe-4S dicluster domain-containing protein [Sinanaerobacter sp. ZZT-01]|uniref:4Fe-4S dicluster domain-containing protein n=1 Tax=Sinanaerobacter sp. ZZT-01 TaxID=3111540 RepID=UPI002D76A0F0|nr:4Fe-4S dicluster domain-containing protein [Sinanaerobacter sp. ZZT-01]WRR92081.1 4Fe-4S dicluster domain-containing protein [Sinanaerobacter sp. ZZT-01]